MATATAPQGRAPIHPLLAAKASAAGRLPGLRKLLARAATLLSGPSVLIPGAELEAAAGDVRTESLHEALDTIGMGAVVARYRLDAWDASLLVAIEPGLAYGLIEAAFGGDGLEEASDLMRAPSRTDLAVIRAVAERLAPVLTRVVTGIRASTVVLAGLDTQLGRIEPETRSRRIVAARIEVTLLGRKAGLLLLLPEDILTELQQPAAAGAKPAAQAVDLSWQSRLAGEVTQADVVVRTLVRDDGMTLADIASLRVGQTLRLGATSTSPVTVEAQGASLFSGHLGQSDGRYNVRIERPLGAGPSPASQHHQRS